MSFRLREKSALRVTYIFLLSNSEQKSLPLRRVLPNVSQCFFKSMIAKAVEQILENKRRRFLFSLPGMWAICWPDLLGHFLMGVLRSFKLQISRFVIIVIKLLNVFSDCCFNVCGVFSLLDFHCSCHFLHLCSCTSRVWRYQSYVLSYKTWLELVACQFHWEGSTTTGTIIWIIVVGTTSPFSGCHGVWQYWKILELWKTF